MTQLTPNDTIAYEDAIDLLDADHKSVKSKFIQFAGLCEAGASHETRQALAERICRDLTIHAQIEEEIFYPAVREAIGDDTLMDEALAEHDQAKALIARIQAMDASSEDYDDTVKGLAKLIDQHVLEEREQIFLDARYSDLDLRGLVVPLYERKKQLVDKPAKEQA